MSPTPRRDPGAAEPRCHDPDPRSPPCPTAWRSRWARLGCLDLIKTRRGWNLPALGSTGTPPPRDGGATAGSFVPSCDGTGRGQSKVPDSPYSAVPRHERGGLGTLGGHEDQGCHPREGTRGHRALGGRLVHCDCSSTAQSTPCTDGRARWVRVGTRIPPAPTSTGRAGTGAGCSGKHPRSPCQCPLPAQSRCHLTAWAGAGPSPWHGASLGHAALGTPSPACCLGLQTCSVGLG